MAKKIPDPTGQKLLIVEDDPFLFHVLVQRLEDEGVDVHTVSDGEAALKEAASWEPHLMLLDLVLPKKSGFDVLKELREDGATKDLAVVVLSNLAEPEEMERIETLGVREYMVKADYSLAEMLDKILAHLDAVTA